jgi:hypothetical protein
MGKGRQATWKPLVAWSLTGSVLVVLAAALVLLGLNASRLNASRLDAGQIGLYGLLSDHAGGRSCGRWPSWRPAWSRSSSRPAPARGGLGVRAAPRREPERRQQLAWLGYVGALTVVWAVLLVLANLLVRGQAMAWSPACSGASCS